MPTISLKIAGPPRDSANNGFPGEARPLFVGTGDTDYLCGNCEAVMAARMGPGQRVIVDTATCAACGAVNEFPVNIRG